MGQIDFHTHILPGIDDGSKSASMSVEMLKMLKLQGVDTVIATPHFYPSLTDPEAFLSKRGLALDALTDAARKQECELPKLCVGAEVAYFDGMSSSKSVSKLCIEGTSLMLLEMPFGAWGKSELRELSGLIEGMGITPIIAHVERYIKYQKKEVLSEIVSMGAILQCNAEAFLRLKTRRAALKLLRDGCVIGSDCHDLDSRSPNIEGATALIERKLGRESLVELSARGTELISGAKTLVLA